MLFTFFKIWPHFCQQNSTIPLNSSIPRHRETRPVREQRKPKLELDPNHRDTRPRVWHAKESETWPVDVCRWTHNKTTSTGHNKSLPGIMFEGLKNRFLRCFRSCFLPSLIRLWTRKHLLDQHCRVLCRQFCEVVVQISRKSTTDHVPDCSAGDLGQMIMAGGLYPIDWTYRASFYGVDISYQPVDWLFCIWPACGNGSGFWGNCSSG